jgi:hypothetical protein
MRSLVVLFAIAEVLLCPYTCMVQAAASRVTTTKVIKVTCCEQCRERCVAGDQKSPERRVPADDDTTCLCDGAVFAACAGSPVDTLLFSSHWTIAVDSATQLESSASKRIAFEDTSPPPGSSGRQVRIEILSFLL